MQWYLQGGQFVLVKMVNLAAHLHVAIQDCVKYI